MNYDVVSRKLECGIVIELGMLNFEVEIVIDIAPALGIVAASFLKGDRGTRSHILKRYSE